MGSSSPLYRVRLVEPLSLHVTPLTSSDRVKPDTERTVTSGVDREAYHGLRVIHGKSTVDIPAEIN